MIIYNNNNNNERLYKKKATYTLELKWQFIIVYINNFHKY